MSKFLVSVSREFTYTFLVDGVDKESAFVEYKKLEHQGVLNDAIVSIEACDIPLILDAMDVAEAEAEGWSHTLMPDHEKIMDMGM
jgi:hypothetical protein